MKHRTATAVSHWCYINVTLLFFLVRVGSYPGHVERTTPRFHTSFLTNYFGSVTLLHACTKQLCMWACSECRLTVTFAYFPYITVHYTYGMLIIPRGPCPPQTIIFSYSCIQQVSISGDQLLCRGCMLGRHCCPTHTAQASCTKRDLGSKPCESLEALDLIQVSSLN